jgi:tetratricopeptide (TPR) repeat protein
LSIKFVQKGISKYLKEKWEEAEDEFVKAVEANDISAKGWYYLGMCRLKQKDSEGANVCFKKAIASAKLQEPEDQDTQRNGLLELAMIEMKNEQFIAAMGYLKKILQMDFKDNDLRGTVWGILGEIYEGLKKKEYELFCYRQSQKFGIRKYRKQISQLEVDGVHADDPDDKESPSLIKRKADILFNQQKYPEAVNTYIEAVKMNNLKKVLSDIDHAEVVLKIGYSYINVQDFNNAKGYLQEAKRMYTKAKKDDEIKVIDSTLNKLNSLMAT